MDRINISAALGSICVLHSVRINAYSLHITGGIILDFKVSTFCKVRSLL